MSTDDQEAWPEEIEAIKNIKEGKTKMVTQTADEFIKELKELESHHASAAKYKQPRLLKRRRHL